MAYRLRLMLGSGWVGFGGGWWGTNKPHLGGRWENTRGIRWRKPQCCQQRKRGEQSNTGTCCNSQNLGCSRNATIESEVRPGLVWLGAGTVPWLTLGQRRTTPARLAGWLPVAKRARLSAAAPHASPHQLLRSHLTSAGAQQPCCAALQREPNCGSPPRKQSWCVPRSSPAAAASGRIRPRLLASRAAPVGPAVVCTAVPA